MDEELRKLRRQWDRTKDDGDALAYLLRLAKTESLTLLQLWRHVVRLERMASDPTAPNVRELPSWHDVALWLQDVGGPLRPRPAAQAPLPLVPAAQLRRPIDYSHLPVNRGYSREWLAAECRCAHERGAHEGQPEERGPCTLCRRCQRFDPVPSQPCATCGRQTEIGYRLCRAHLAEAFR